MSDTNSDSQTSKKFQRMKQRFVGGRKLGCGKLLLTQEDKDIAHFGTERFRIKFGDRFPLNKFGYPIYWEYDDRPLKLTRKKGKVFECKFRDGGVIDYIKATIEGRPITKKRYETMKDRITELEKGNYDPKKPMTKAELDVKRKEIKEKVDKRLKEG